MVELAFPPGDASPTQLAAAHERLRAASGQLSLSDLLRVSLDEAERLTESSISFFHLVDADQRTLRLQAWSTGTLGHPCGVESSPTVYDIANAGVWIDCLRLMRPVVHNDYASVPERKGLPEGHVGVVRELTVPVIRDGRVVAVLGVGNKPSDYDDRDCEIAVRFAADMWDIVRYRIARENLLEHARQSGCLAEASVMLLEAQNEQRVIDIATRFINLILPDAIVMAHTFAEDGETLVLRGIRGTDERMVAQPCAVTGHDLIGSHSPLTDSLRENLGTRVLRRVEGDFATYAESVLPGGAVEWFQPSDAREIHVIGIADGGQTYGALHMLFERTADDLPSDMIETFAHLCFMTMSRIDIHRRQRLDAEGNALFLDHMLEGLARCQLLYEGNGEVVDYRYIDVNYAFSQLVDVPVDSIVGRTRKEVFGDTDTQLVELYAEVSRTGVPRTFERYSEFLGKYIKTTAYSPEPGAVITLSSDVTAAHESFQALVRSEEKYAVAFQISPDAIAITRRSDGTYLECNEGFCALSGYARSEVVGHTAHEIHVWDDPDDRERMIGLLQASGEVRDYVTLFRRKDGTVFTGSMSARPMLLDGEDCLLSITRDISELEASRARERRHSERLSAMASELAATETRERRTLAEELHDRVSQNLAVAKMQIDTLLHEAGADAPRELVSAVSLLNDAISESRSITFELAPPVLHELGLSSGLRWMCEEIHRIHGLQVHADLEEQLDGCGEQASAFMVRALRELLVNVVKHAGVDEAWVSARIDGGMVCMSVEDHGSGYNLSNGELDRGHRFGLFSLRNRAHYMRGRFKIEAAPGKGVCVTIALPILLDMDAILAEG